MVSLQVHFLVLTGTFSGSFTGSPFGSNRIQNGTFVDLLWIRKMSTMVSFVDPQNGSNWTFSGSIQRSLNGFTQIKIDYFHYNPVAANACRSPSLNSYSLKCFYRKWSVWPTCPWCKWQTTTTPNLCLLCYLYLKEKREDPDSAARPAHCVTKAQFVSITSIGQKSVLYRSPFVGGVSDIQLI